MHQGLHQSPYGVCPCRFSACQRYSRFCNNFHKFTIFKNRKKLKNCVIDGRRVTSINYVLPCEIIKNSGFFRLGKTRGRIAIVLLIRTNIPGVRVWSHELEEEHGGGAENFKPGYPCKFVRKHHVFHTPKMRWAISLTDKVYLEEHSRS